MLRYLRKNGIVIFFSSLICGITIYLITLKPIDEEKVVLIKRVTPKTDSIIAAADSVVNILNDQQKERIKLKKEKEILEKELKIQKTKKPKISEKTKIVVQTKEVIVEKEVKVEDPNSNQILIENYRIKNENCVLREELEKIKKVKKESLKKIELQKDTISTDTIRKKKRFFLF